MRSGKRANKRMIRFAAAVLCIVMGIMIGMPMTAHAHADETTVRVGWHEAPYFMTDEYGRSSGYTYEYQMKLSAYTGWTYEYVKGGWSELVQMLKTGEIDLLGNLSYTEERARDVLYASVPMGSEAYYLFVSPRETAIHSEDYSSLNGKTIGVTKDSMQKELLEVWLETHGIRAKVIELTTTEKSSLRYLGRRLDAFVTMDVHADPDSAVPLWKIGSSDYYFAVSKDRPDLLAELNAALNSIQDENKNYSQQLYDKYLRSAETNLYLSAEEKEWLSAHGTIRVGYQDNYLAFCASDPGTGALTGALKDYLDYAADGMENAHLDFEAVAYPTAAAAIEALQNGEVDCMFPANLSASDGEKLGLVMTPALMTTEMDAVVRAAEQKEFIRKEQVTVTVNEGNTNYELFLLDHYPGWRIKYYPDTPAGLEAIAAGEADCVIISNYRFNNIAKQCEKLRLATVYTGVDMEYYLAVRSGDTELYSILTKITGIVPESTVHTALTYYSTEDAKIGFLDIIREHLALFLLAIAVVVLVVVVLLLRSLRAEKKALEEERMIRTLNRHIYVDSLTSVKNRRAFSDDIQDLQDRADSGEAVEFAIGVFDCDDLKLVNDSHGHDKGDAYLRAASALISRVFRNSSVYRVGGDEFAVILQGEAYRNREALIAEFEREKADVCASAENLWEQVRIALGVVAYDPQLDRSVFDVARRADKIMYENKRLSKLERS